MVVVVEEVGHLVGSEGTPAAVGTVTAVDNLVVTPLVAASQLGSVAVGEGVAGTPNLDAVTNDSTAVVVTVSTPREEVAVVLVLDFLLAGTAEIPLVVGKTPDLVGQRDIFEVTLGEYDIAGGLASGCHIELTVQSTHGVVDHVGFVDDNIHVVEGFSAKGDGCIIGFGISLTVGVEVDNKTIVGASGDSHTHQLRFASELEGGSELHGVGSETVTHSGVARSTSTGAVFQEGGVGEVDFLVTVEVFVGSDGDAVDSHIASQMERDIGAEVIELEVLECSLCIQRPLNFASVGINGVGQSHLIRIVVVNNRGGIERGQHAVGLAEVAAYGSVKDVVGVGF